jgi:DNA-binding NarL/FixJ family response regulator
VIRILLADDQSLVRAGFRLILETEADLEVVGETADGRQTVAATRELRPDLVLMDIRMPVLDGIGATRELASAGSTAKVLVLTTFDDDALVHDALRAGASGFLLKDVDPPDLVRACRTVVRDEALLAPAITRRLIERFLATPPPGRPPTVFSRLTERELEVFTLMARGLDNQQVADRLVISATTVRTHVTRILAKLGLRDRVQAVVLGYESGLVRPGEGA